MSAGLIDSIRHLLSTLLPSERAAKIDHADVATSTRATPADVENRVANVLNAAIPPGPNTDSLYERIKTLDDNMSAARAALIDVAISSRATPADIDAKLTNWFNAAIAANPVANSPLERIKALDDNYTAARAAYLDIISASLDATVGSRATPANVTAARDVLSAAVAALHADFATVNNQIAALSYLLTHAWAAGELQTWLGTAANLTAIQQLLSVPESAAAIAADTSAMTAIAASSTAMAAVVASPQAR